MDAASRTMWWAPALYHRAFAALLAVKLCFTVTAPLRIREPTPPAAEPRKFYLSRRKSRAFPQIKRPSPDSPPPMPNRQNLTLKLWIEIIEETRQEPLRPMSVGSNSYWLFKVRILPRAPTKSRSDVMTIAVDFNPR